MPVSTRRDELLLRKRLDRFTRMLHGLKARRRAVRCIAPASRRGGLREVLPVLQLDAHVAQGRQAAAQRSPHRLGHRPRAGRRCCSGLTSYRGRAFSRRVPGRWRRPWSKERDRARRPALKAADRRAAPPRDEDWTRSPARSRRRTSPRARGAASRAWRMGDRGARSRGARPLSAPAIVGAARVYLPERLHQVRIAVKKLRYALELLADSPAAKTTPELRALRRTQEYSDGCTTCRC